ncbi:exported hypothetical protein [Acidobacteriia bacterium SbA2]|nr:exported hypothetical protein [Acidobacteriia bacterium SbA2]
MRAVLVMMCTASAATSSGPTTRPPNGPPSQHLARGLRVGGVNHFFDLGDGICHAGFSVMRKLSL